jgi:hypothetical protein
LFKVIDIPPLTRPDARMHRCDPCVSKTRDESALLLFFAKPGFSR